ncbi:MAG: DMT family transporter [Nitrospirae bacterium]|nr:DMT family transporter [Nitrospirota bacterium]MBI3392405.1 DMT family transporter [Nitrospirota bacterium]
MLFGFHAVSVRWANTYVPPVELAFFRSFGHALIILVLAAAGTVALSINNRRLLVWRGLFGGAAVILYYMAICRIGAGPATLLTYTYPVFATLFSALFAREPLTLRAGAPLAVSLAGAGLILGHEGFGVSLGDVMGISAGIFSGAAISTVRELRKTDSAWPIFFYFAAVGSVMTAPALPFTSPVWPGVMGFVGIAAIVVTSFGGQILMTYAYRFTTAAEGSTVSLLTSVHAAILGAAFFSEPITLRLVAGGALVIAAGAWLTFSTMAAETPGRPV